MMFFPIGVYFDEASEKMYRLTGWMLADTDTIIAPTEEYDDGVLFTLTPEIVGQLGLKEGDAITFTSLWSEETE